MKRCYYNDGTGAINKFGHSLVCFYCDGVFVYKHCHICNGVLKEKARFI